MKKKLCGFFLIQTVVVLLLLGIIISLSVTHLRSMTRFLVQAEIEKLDALFYYAQQTAIATQAEQQVHCDTKNNCYSYQEITRKLTPGVAFGTIKNVLGPPSNPIKPITQCITFANECIHFFPDGTISSGALYITDIEKNCCYALTNGIAQVNYIRKYRYDISTKRWILLQ